MKKRKKPRRRIPPIYDVSSESTSSSSEEEGATFHIEPFLRRKVVKSALEDSLSEERDDRGTKAESTKASDKERSSSKPPISLLKRSLEDPSVETFHSIKPKGASLEEQSAYLVDMVLSSLFHGWRKSSDRHRIDLRLNSKMVQSTKRRSSGPSTALLKEDIWRRHKTRSLIERMQHKLGPLVSEGEDTTHALRPSEVREALTDPEFEEIAQEFKVLYGA